MPSASLSLLVLALSIALAPAVAAAPTAAEEVPKTVIVGFDGMDHGLSRRFMDQGLMPNFTKLAEQGTFQRLETSNPAQSPVSWAVFNTGTNPGKTGVGGFVSRFFVRNPDGSFPVDDEGQRIGQPLPQPMLGFAEKMPASEFIGFPMALEQLGLFLGLSVGLPLLAAFLVFKLLKAKTWLALLLGLAAGAGGWFWGVGYSASLPADGMMPYEINPMQGTNWWNYLDEAGVRLTGVQVATTFPPDAEGPNTRLLSGLGVKDIGGSPGSWFVFTDDPWSWSHETNTAGQIVKISFDQAEETRAVVDLPGPNNWVEEADYKHRLEVLEAHVEHPDNTEEESDALGVELRKLKSEYNKFKRDKKAKVSFTMDADKAAGTLAFKVGGEQFTLGVGEWSDFIRIEYVLNERFSSFGVVRFHLMRCDDEEVRIFVPPVNIDPYAPPEHLPISSPPEFASELAHGIGGAYETLGWACMTNPLKDAEDSFFEVQSFMDDIVATMERRERILDWNLDHADAWDVYYQVLSTTDRIGHMLYREYDPEHPEYDATYANSEVNAWGKSFPLKDALPEVYAQADRIVGAIMERIESGELGEDCLLLVVADHGFTSFRRGVNLNNLLHNMGYLVFKDGKTLKQAGGMDLLGFVDWSQSRAYSMGLGKVFLNVEGREPKGIVKPEDYDKVADAICADLLAVTDGEGGPKVVTSASKRGDLFSGPWVVEGTAQQLVRGELRPKAHDGFADIFLGFEPYYRVSWGNTLGGLDASSIVNNTKHWSGGHVSVDPEHVAGIFYSNRKFSEPARASLLDIGPTVLVRYGISLDDTDVDGKALPLADGPK
jgi:predicted AlkP superfamily phosphohydrolase/phosphomutase